MADLPEPDMIDDSLSPEEMGMRGKSKALKSNQKVNSWSFAFSEGIPNSMRTMLSTVMKFAFFAGMLSLISYGIAEPLLGKAVLVEGGPKIGPIDNIIKHASDLFKGVITGVVAGGLWKVSTEVSNAYTEAEKHNAKVDKSHQISKFVALNPFKNVSPAYISAVEISHLHDKPTNKITSPILLSASPSAPIDRELPDRETPAYIRDIISRGSKQVSPQQILEQRTENMMKEFER